MKNISLENLETVEIETTNKLRKQSLNDVEIAEIFDIAGKYFNDC